MLLAMLYNVAQAISRCLGAILLQHSNNHSIGAKTGGKGLDVFYWNPAQARSKAWLGLVFWGPGFGSSFGANSAGHQEQKRVTKCFIWGQKKFNIRPHQRFPEPVWNWAMVWSLRLVVVVVVVVVDRAAAANHLLVQERLDGLPQEGLLPRSWNGKSKV